MSKPLRDWTLGQRYIAGFGVELTAYEPAKGEAVYVVTAKDTATAIRLILPKLQEMEGR